MREDQPIICRINGKRIIRRSIFPKSPKTSDGGSERGLFFLKASGWDPRTKKYIQSASNALYSGDRSWFSEKNADHISDVFVDSIKNGQPVAGVTVELLGRNGIAVQNGLTSPDGHVTFLQWTKRARKKAGRLHGATR